MRCRSVFLNLLVFTMLLFTATQVFPQGREHPESILGVDTFMRNVDRHRGVVQVEGVVSAISEKDQTLALIDTREFQECGVTTCASLQLPVRWEGVSPRGAIWFELQERRRKLMGNFSLLPLPWKRLLHS